MTTSAAAPLEPGTTGCPVSLEQARRYCRRFTLGHYENFPVVTLLLPRRLHPHFHAVYAFCRFADDLADEAGDETHALALLQWWRKELLACYERRPRHPIMVALSDTVHRFQIPARPFLDLLLAFEQDQCVASYTTFNQLLGYCQRSANPVGRLILYLGECFSPSRATLSDHICTGLQLANFWQDVARDLTLGRIYLPEEDRRRFGYPDRALVFRQCTPAFVEMMRFQVERTRCFFEAGRPLLDDLPSFLRVDVELFLEGGLRVLRKIEAIRYNVWERRPTLSRWEKTGLLARAVRRKLWTKLRSFLPSVNHG